jgi:hypothetical protein
MVASKSIESSSLEPANTDLLRRYCPGLALYTHAHIAAHVAPDANGCWPWDGGIADTGYGHVSLKPTPYGYNGVIAAHRFMYDLLVGPIPEGHDIHHRCHHKPCWHPMHLNRSARHWYTDTGAQAQVLGCSGRHVYESYAL